MKKILAVIGARPQFVKHAPVEIAAKGIFDLVGVHTGQHYDYKMSQVFFEELEMAKPDYNLMVGSGLHGEQTARMMIELEPIIIKENPNFVLVYGDTNSTLAGALVASKLEIPIVHIEAGLRSFNRSMPEEINRVLTDHLSSFLFVPTQLAIDNLAKEGIHDNVYNIGDVMFDMLQISEHHGVFKKERLFSYDYCFATIHRPYNTDEPDRMEQILKTFESLPIRVVFAVHPRTYKKIQERIDLDNYRNIEFSEPLSYFDTIATIYNSKYVITDSGGIQKEAYLLRKKCITLRSETEWMETLINGWNTLVFDHIDQIGQVVKEIPGDYVSGLYGDGKAAQKIISILDNGDIEK